MGSVADGIDGLEARCDDGSLVTDGGLLSTGTVMARLGLEALIDAVARPPGAGRGSGAKVLSLVASMLVGGSHVDDADGLRAGSAGAVQGFEPLAPSTLGTFARSFTFGHLRQPDRAQELALGRAWSLGAAPQRPGMTVDLDSTVCEVHGKSKQGTAYGHTKVLGYHPLLAARGDTGEFVRSRMRSGSSQRGHVRFVSETVARLRLLAPRAAVTVRADAGLFSYDMLDLIAARGAHYSITVAQNPKAKTAIAAIDEHAWAPIPHTRGGAAQVAETTIDTGRRDNQGTRRLRLIVRRARLQGPQSELWPNWRHHCLVTSRSDLDTEAADAYHRAHARVEPTIRDPKDTGLRHCPSGKSFANGVRLACAAHAHNITRWTAPLGRAQHPGRLTAVNTVRQQPLTVPARLVNHSHRHILRQPRHWPRTHTYTQALQQPRNPPLLN